MWESMSGRACPKELSYTEEIEGIDNEMNVRTLNYSIDFLDWFCDRVLQVVPWWS